jgi:hypothetical protein
VWVARHHRTGGQLPVEGEVSFGGEQCVLVGGLGADRREVDLDVDERGRAAAGGGQQVLDELGHPAHRAGDQCDGVGACGGGGVVDGEYGVHIGLDDGEGVA